MLIICGVIKPNSSDTLTRTAYKNAAIHHRGTNYVINKLPMRSGQLVAVYHIPNGHFGAELGNWLKVDNSNRQEHSQKLYKPRKDDLRAALRISIRASNEWKTLPPSVSMVPSVELFKKLLYGYTSQTFITACKRMKSLELFDMFEYA